jgi:hypothetical protein
LSGREVLLTKEDTKILQNKHTWRAEAFEIHEGSKQGVLFRASYVVSFAFPQSMTKTMSFIVILASAMLVASTTFRTLGGSLSNISLCGKT